MFRDSQYLPPPTDQSTGPVNRQIKVIVRSVGEHRVDMNGVNGYHSHNDAISIINLNRWCRRIGVPIPKAYWSRLWLVRDCAGYGGAGFTWFLIIAGEVMFFMVLVSRALSFFSIIHGLVSFTCATLGFIAHLRAMFSNPVYEQLTYFFTEFPNYLMIHCV